MKEPTRSCTMGSVRFHCLWSSIYKEKDVALKRMKKIPSVVESRYLLREFQMQMRFKHECILEIYGHSEDPSGFPILVIEFGGTSLEDLVIRKGIKSLLLIHSEG